MAYNDKALKRDRDASPIPQVWNEAANEYEPARGTDGRQHTILYDAQGNPVDFTQLVAMVVEAINAGSDRSLRGRRANRPAADAVREGTTYWAVDRIGFADEMSVSDGSTWTNI